MYPASPNKSPQNSKLILDLDVAHAPSNVEDAAAGKSFMFINIVARSAVMGTLLRAAFTLMCALVLARRGR